MGENIDDDNPFLSLFPTVEEAREFRDEIYRNRDVLFRQESPPDKEKGKKGSKRASSSSPTGSAKDKEKTDQEISSIIEHVFLITVNTDGAKKSHRPVCVFLHELSHIMQGRTYMVASDLEEVVYERLMLEDPEKHLERRPEKKGDTKAEAEATESLNMRYLYMSYYRSLMELAKTQSEGIIEKCQQTIITYSRMVLCHPDVYEGQHSTTTQFINLFLEYYGNSTHHDHFLKFLERMFKEIELANLTSEEDVQLAETVYPILDQIHDRYKTCSLVDSDLMMYLPMIYFFSRVPALAKVLLDHSTPRTATLGRAYGTTLLGTLLNFSCLPAFELGPFEYFDHPSQTSQQDHSIMEQNLWGPLRNVGVERYELFNRLMRASSDVRHQCLTWLGNCCHSNAGRARLWTQHVQSMLSTDVSDSFMLNLGNVMLRLCKPFAESSSPKLLKINPTYCADVMSHDEDVKQRGIYLRDIHAETCLITPPEGVRRASAPGYNFTTICFFVTHRILNLGFNPIVEKFMRLNQELARTQRLYEDAVRQAGENSQSVQPIKERMEHGMSQFLSYKAALLEPDNLELMLSFHSATSTWLTHIATCSEFERFQAVLFPLPATNLHYLACVPEFIIDGLAEFVIFLRRFSTKTLELAGDELQNFMTLILIFMGSAERIRNPHLRAKLAEMLEALMPHEDDKNLSSIINVHREKLFAEHPFVGELVPTLLNVFVSIEMTGQSVAFEQKFNYRRPMYVVMDYVWKIGVHREIFKSLARDAEQNMEAITPPLFLRFINLLINDAIFLLDEALTYMTRLHEQQQLRNTSNLRNLPVDQRQQNEANYQHMGMLARFHNVMGNSTIHTLEILTREITSIFTHPTIVDRMAAMLNYFLLHLVGPKRRQLKVKDFAEYDFKPPELVRDISLIYLHLGESLEFCQAVSRDGRSYSPVLFVQAEQVLNKIGQGALVYQLQDLAARVADIAVKQHQEDEILSEAPEEFVDPIMGTVMKDPVTLPSSSVTVDRATIARHLLSDQTDPFNRSPLSMDMVQSNHDLKIRIAEWFSRASGSLTQTDLSQPSTSRDS